MPCFGACTDQGRIQRGERPCGERYVCHGRGADMWPQGYWPQVKLAAALLGELV